MGIDLSRFGLDDALKNIYIKLMEKYKGKLNDSLVNMIRIAINDSNSDSRRLQLEAIKESFNLSDKELNKYVTILRIESMYINMCNELEAILELVSNDEDLISDLSEEINEIEIKIEEFRKLISSFYNDSEKSHKYSFDGNNDKEDVSSLELSTNSNFLIFLSNVDELRKNTVQSRSGIWRNSMAKICNEMISLSCYSYGSLISKGESHNINDNGKHVEFTSRHLQFRRTGGGTTKVGYVKVPVISNNLVTLKNKYKNNNLEYIFIVVGFGDFVNEGISEEKLYGNFISIGRKWENEIEKIISIFSNPFTPESFALACSIIEHGVDVVDSLRNNPLDSIERNGALVR